VLKPLSQPNLARAEFQREAETAVANLVAELQGGLDSQDSDLYNRSFAGDVVWGGPYGATVTGFDTLHAIHQRLQSTGSETNSRYDVVRVMAPAEDIAVAHVRRRSLDVDDPTAFSEMALYVLIKRHDRWWLAAGQNTIIRPGRSAVRLAGTALSRATHSVSNGFRGGYRLTLSRLNNHARTTTACPGCALSRL
jgi:uncharacterized protein (TIGR02246 family)